MYDLNYWNYPYIKQSLCGIIYSWVKFVISTKHSYEIHYLKKERLVMGIKESKPKLTSEEQIEHLKEKGIKFSLCTEEEAKNYLDYNNNYFKVSSFRKNYSKIPYGKNADKYNDLEFEYLKDLAIIDMTLRYTVIQMALDIEHFAKLYILRKINETPVEDGYSIVVDFMNSLEDKQRKAFEDEIGENRVTTYNSGMIHKYNNEMPVWVMIEIIPFGRLISFFKFCSVRFNDIKMKRLYYCLRACKDIRNAAAHSNCILNDLHLSNSEHNASHEVMNALAKIPTLSTNSRRKKMTNDRIREIITLMYTHKELVSSEGVHNKTSVKLREFVSRMNRNINYYKDNSLIHTSFDFIEKVIDFWF